MPEPKFNLMMITEDNMFMGIVARRRQIDPAEEEEIILDYCGVMVLPSLSQGSVTSGI